MATVTMAATDVASYNNTLAATTVDTVNVGRDCDLVRVYNDSGTAAIFFTADGTTPTVNGSNCFRVPASAGAFTTATVTGSGNTTVKLISSGTPTYSVQGSI